MRASTRHWVRDLPGEMVSARRPNYSRYVVADCYDRYFFSSISSGTAEIHPHVRTFHQAAITGVYPPPGGAKCTVTLCLQYCHAPQSYCRNRSETLDIMTQLFQRLATAVPISRPLNHDARRSSSSPVRPSRNDPGDALLHHHPTPRESRGRAISGRSGAAPRPPSPPRGSPRIGNPPRNPHGTPREVTYRASQSLGTELDRIARSPAHFVSSVDVRIEPRAARVTHSRLRQAFERAGIPQSSPADGPRSPPPAASSSDAVLESNLEMLRSLAPADPVVPSASCASWARRAPSPSHMRGNRHEMATAMPPFSSDASAGHDEAVEDSFARLWGEEYSMPSGRSAGSDWRDI